MASTTTENVGPCNRPRVFKNTPGVLTCLIAAFFVASCNQYANEDHDLSKQSAYQPPVIKPMAAFSHEREMDWNNVKSEHFSTTTISLDINKLPVTSYADTGSFKPFSKAVNEENFGGLSRLPQKRFDISKLPSKKLVYRSVVLKAPKVIKAGPPQTASNNNLGLYGLSDAQGLNGLLITCLFHDHDGFLWIATDKGIYRYDGQNLARYITDPMRNTLCMAEDSEGRIWMGSQYDGVGIFNPKTGEYAVIGKEQGLAGNSIYCLLTDGYGRIWAGGNAGVNIIDPKKNRITRFTPASGLFSGRLDDIKTGDRQDIWLASKNDLGVIDLKSNKITYLSGLAAFRSLNNPGALFCDSKKDIWISSQDNNSLAVIDTRTNIAYTLHETEKSDVEVTGFSEDQQGHVWYTYKTGIKMIDLDRRTAKDIYISKFDNYANNIIVETLPAETGDMWIGTTSGLLLYRSNNLEQEHIGDQSIAAVGDDNNGLIYSGSNNGLKLIDRRRKTIRVLNIKNGLLNDSIQNVVLAPNGDMNINTNGGFNIIRADRKHMENFKGIRCYSNVTDNTGKIWIAGLSGLEMYDPGKQTLTHFGRENGLGRMNDVLIDKDNNLWAVGVNGMFYVIDAQRKRIRELDFKLPQQTNFIAVLMHDTGINRWIGTPKGVFIVNPVKNTVSRLSVPQGLVDESVISLLRRGDNVYAGTNKGISVITIPPHENDNWKIISFGREYGLEKINVGYWMTDNLTREGDYIWGDKGLSILDLNGHMQRVEPAVYLTALNIMDEPAYFTAHIPGATDSTQLYNTGGKVAGPYNQPVNLQLPYNKNSLQFSFVSRSAFKSDTAWYRYMLTGADKTWRKKTSETTTGDYFNLLPGQYTFRVSSMANDGTWSSPATFNFTILPPWWQTWWARAWFIILFAWLIWFIVHLRSQSLLRSKKLLEQKVALRTQEVLEQKEEIAAQRDNLEQALTDLKQAQSQLVQSEKMASLGELTAGIAHEIQNPLNFVNNFSEVNTELIDELREEIEKGNLEEIKAIATDLQENEKKINVHGKRADAIVKGMLQHSRAGSGQKEPTDINKLADEYLRLSYHGLRAKDKTFNAEMITHFDEKLPMANILPQEFGRVLLNMFNNAFYAVNQKKKTAPADYKPIVEVSTFTPPSGGWGVVVKDNGMGIPDAVKDKIMQPFFTTKPTGEGTGLGLSLSYDIVVKGHGGNIDIKSTEGEGSTFTITLPFHS